ncbi:hypothetical protein PROFUN_00443 [Planoprotostelium fungivorum]|uniref:Biogenesis of lysosome-related organelles complex 1 subunit 5 n=1 Tax=Planoprotostelium fungivorum TaxID=1890364 RepID=A0A2P6N0V3_9EUKA|nr:hypothetical protein PROFUN_00443 [Planoprotostelium fungivorum]
MVISTDELTKAMGNVYGDIFDWRSSLEPEIKSFVYEFEGRRGQEDLAALQRTSDALSNMKVSLSQCLSLIDLHYDIVKDSVKQSKVVASLQISTEQACEVLTSKVFSLDTQSLQREREEHRVKQGNLEADAKQQIIVRESENRSSIEADFAQKMAELTAKYRD